MPRQEIGEMLAHADGSHARPSAAMRNAEGFVEVQMANVHAQLPGTAKADQGIQIRAIHIYLTAAPVNHVDYLAECLFKDAVRGRVRHHESSKTISIFPGLCFQIAQI